MGLAEGLTYANTDIQTGINNVFLAQMDIQEASFEKQAQDIRNDKDVNIAIAKRKSAQQFAQAQIAQKIMISLKI
jgi:hypothetical protein